MEGVDCHLPARSDRSTRTTLLDTVFIMILKLPLGCNRRCSWRLLLPALAFYSCLHVRSSSSSWWSWRARYRNNRLAKAIRGRVPLGTFPLFFNERISISLGKCSLWVHFRDAIWESDHCNTSAISHWLQTMERKVSDVIISKASNPPLSVSFEAMRVCEARSRSLWLSTMLYRWLARGGVGGGISRDAEREVGWLCLRPLREAMVI